MERDGVFKIFLKFSKTVNIYKINKKVLIFPKIIHFPILLFKKRDLNKN